MLIGVVLLVLTAVASARGTAVTAIKREYRRVALAEYFGPAAAVCGQLTASGVHSYTDGTGRCAAAFHSNQRAFQLKFSANPVAGARDWRAVVSAAVAHLTVTVHGGHATAIDRSGSFGQTRLAKSGRAWKFSSAPPLP